MVDEEDFDLHDSREKKPEFDQEAADWKWLMKSKQGRRIAWTLLSKAGVYRTTFTGEALSGAFNEGRRDMGLHIVARIYRAAPGRHLTMVKENRTHDDRSGG